MKSVTVKAFAKINLGLSVIGRREDGFHELRTIFQTISLADELEVTLAAGRGGVRLEASGIAVPGGKENLAVRAAEAAAREWKLSGRVLLRLRKRIPPGSGLGGASSDAAAVLRALRYLSGKTIPAARLFGLAARLGSDVPFFLLGGRALGIGRGEEVYALPEGLRRWCVIVFPGAGMDTAEAYRRLRAPLLTASAARPTIELFCAQANNADAAGSGGMGNDFEPVVFSLFPALGEAKRVLLRSGAEVAALTGSGSAIFGWFRDGAAARKAARRLDRRDRQGGEGVFVARTVSRREFEKQWLVVSG